MQEFLKKNIVLDYLKVVLILMVLGIHAPLSIGISICGVDVLQPFFRMAVPLFFIMSSYFFFGKIHSLNNRNEVYAALKRFIKRNALLYIFWFLLLLPITIHLRWNWWIAPGGIKGAVTFCMNLFFGGTFFASWFLSALLIDVIVIFFASRRLSNGILLVIGIFLYCIAVLFSGFSSVVYKFYPSLESVAIFRAMSLLIPTSFVSAFIWIVIGKIVSENNNLS